MLMKNRAVIVDLDISTWTARKYDRGVSREVAAVKSADYDAGRYNKHLLAGQSEALKQVEQCATTARGDYYHHTLPWDNAGRRLLPTKGLMDFMALMRQHKATFEQAVTHFLDCYEALVAAAPRFLGALYSPNDFPDKGSVAEKFRFNLSYEPVPQADDFRVELPDSIKEELEQQGAKLATERMAGAAAAAKARLIAVLEHAKEKLQDPNAIFRDSLIGNIRDLAGVMDSFADAVGDESIRTLAKKALEDVAVYEPDELRKNKAVRQDAASKADAILAAVKAIR